MCLEEICNSKQVTFTGSPQLKREAQQCQVALWRLIWHNTPLQCNTF